MMMMMIPPIPILPIDLSKLLQYEGGYNDDDDNDDHDDGDGDDDGDVNDDSDDDDNVACTHCIFTGKLAAARIGLV